MKYNILNAEGKMEGKITWGGDFVYVTLGKRSFDKTYKFRGYECFPIRNDYRNRNIGAKWLFELDESNHQASTKNNGYPVLFIKEGEITKL